MLRSLVTVFAIKKKHRRVRVLRPPSTRLLSLDELHHVSSRFFDNLKKEQTLRSCSCGDGFLGFNSDNRDLWKYVDLFDDDTVPLASARKTSYCFCTKHGDEACRALIAADKIPLEELEPA